MTTLVKFLKHPSDSEVFAYFPNINYNERLYGSSQKESYSSVGQHSACSVEYSLECVEASANEYSDLLKELEQIGYSDIVVANELKEQVKQNNTYNEALDKLSKESKDFESFSQGFNEIENKFKPGK